MAADGGEDFGVGRCPEVSVGGGSGGVSAGLQAFSVAGCAASDEAAVAEASGEAVTLRWLPRGATAAASVEDGEGQEAGSTWR